MQLLPFNSLKVPALATLVGSDRMKYILSFLLCFSVLAQQTVNNFAVRTNLVANFVGASNTNIVIVSPYTTASYGVGNYGPTTGETSFEFINSGKQYQIRQSGVIRQVKFSVGSMTGVTGCQVKVWRQVSSGVWVLIGTSEDLLSQMVAGSVNTLLLNGIDANIGDYLAVRLTYSSASSQTLRSVAPLSGGSTLYAVSNSVPNGVGFAWTSQYPTANSAVVIEAYMTAPSFVSIGDSIMAGNAQGASYIEPAGTPIRFGDIGWLVSQATGWTYQNMGIGGNSMVQIANRFNSDVAALKPKLAIMEGGVNELIYGTNALTTMVSWTNALNSCVAAGIKPVVVGVLPFRNYVSATDAKLEQRDILNGLLRSFAISVGGIYVDPDLTVGSFYAGGSITNRWALSELADSGDGLHLSRWGQTQLANQVVSSLSSITSFGIVDAGSLRVGTSLTFGGGPAMIDGGRNTVVNGQGTTVTVKAVGASRQSTNGNGGSLVLRGGDATGNGTSYVEIQSPVSGASGTDDAIYATRIRTEGNGVWMPGQNLAVGGNTFAPDPRFGIFYNGAPPSDGFNNIGIAVVHSITNAVSGTASGLYISESVGSGVTQTPLAGVRVINPIGAGTVGRFAAFWAESLSKGTVANTYFQAGGSSISSTPYSFYSEATNAVYFAGSHFGVGAAPQGRYGTYIRSPNIGDGVDARALQVVNDATNNITGTLTGIGSLLAPGAGSAYTSGANLVLYDGLGSGVITNNTQLFIQTPIKGSLYNSALAIGGATPPYGNYSIYSSITNSVWLQTPYTALGSIAPDARFGLYFAPQPRGDGIFVIGQYIIPTLTNAVSSVFSGAWIVPTIAAGVTQKDTTNLDLRDQAGSGVTTNHYRLRIPFASTPPGGNVAVLIGTGPTSGKYPIYSSDTNSSYMAGPVETASVSKANSMQVKTVTWTSGAGNPEGVVTAEPGSFFSRTTGGAGTTFYVKESGSGNTGWVAK